MEEILKAILKELQYHTKLMEHIYEKPEMEQTQKTMHQNMEMLQTEIMKHPALKDNPQTMNLINNMFNMIPGRK